MLRDPSPVVRGPPRLGSDELVETTDGRVGQSGANDHRPVALGRRDDLALSVHGREHVAAIERDVQLDDLRQARRRSPSARRNSSIPSPVTALTATEPGWSITSSLATAGARSALLTTISSGTSWAPISASTVRTAVICPSGSGALASTTWTR
jgi:hypothetical protein